MVARLRVASEGAFHPKFGWNVFLLDVFVECRTEFIPLSIVNDNAISRIIRFYIILDPLLTYLSIQFRLWF